MNPWLLLIAAYFLTQTKSTAVNNAQPVQNGSQLTTGEVPTSAFVSAGAGTLVNASDPMYRILTDNNGAPADDLVVLRGDNYAVNPQSQLFKGVAVLY